MLAFGIWLCGGLLFVGIGLWAFRAKEPVGFWANGKPPQVSDLRGYNRAMGKLWCVFGVGFIVLGLPLLAEERPALMLLSVLGVFAQIIALILVYVLGIERKYTK